MRLKLTTPLLSAIGAMVMVSTLFLSFYLSTRAYRAEDSGIILPSEVDSVPVVEIPLEQNENNDLTNVELTAENVQQVIASLQRPEAYSCTIQNTVYFGDKRSTVTRYQSMRDGVCRTDEIGTSGSIIRSSVRTGGSYYAWKTGNGTYYKGAAGSFSDDAAGMLPTYETVVTLPRENLREINIVNLDYEPCIMVGAIEGGFHSVYYISTVTGLLKRADVFEGEKLIRSCNVKVISNEIPDISLYTLPDGIVVEGIQQRVEAE